MKEEFGVLTIWDQGNKKTYPTYTCGHCSNVVVMRPDRTRERTKCIQCGRTICEQTEICATHCTPLPELARDHMEAKGEWKKYVPAIMAGVDKKDEALSMGLILL